MISTADWVAATRPLDPVKDRDELHARNAAIFASSTAAPYILGDYKIVKPPKAKRVKAVGCLVIHIVPGLSAQAVTGPALCGQKTGRACEDPSAVTLIVDRFCSRCWNRWSKARAA